MRNYHPTSSVGDPTVNEAGVAEASTVGTFERMIGGRS